MIRAAFFTSCLGLEATATVFSDGVGIKSSILTLAITFVSVFNLFSAWFEIALILMFKFELDAKTVEPEDSFEHFAIFYLQTKERIIKLASKMFILTFIL